MASVMTIEPGRHLLASLELDSASMQIKQEIPDHEDDKYIHSGHFMLSRVHDPSPEDDDDEDEQTPDVEPTTPYDFTTSKKETSVSYDFKSPSQKIDSSLSKLFECLSLAYSGKLVSPKWKAFRGLHMSITDKVRLNNIIWREWHMQYIYGKRCVICQFASPLSDDIHTRPEAIVLEGKYWKRRLDTVTTEYKRWRKYFKTKIARTKPDPNLSQVLSHAELLDRLQDIHQVPYHIQHSSTDLLLESMDIDFNQDLFSSLNQPFAFPTAKEFTGFGISDLTQPGLLSLQPNIEEFPMDTFDLQEMIQFSQSQTIPTNNIVHFTGSNDQSQNRFQTIAQHDIDMKTTPSPGQLEVEGQTNNDLLNLLLYSDTQQPTQIQVTNNVLSQLLQGQQLLPGQSSAIDSSNVVQTVPIGTQAKDTTLTSLQAALTGNIKQAGTKVSESVPTKTGGGKRQTKKDGFVVPQGKPAQSRMKTRNIAPAPQKSSYSALEELLKTGTLKTKSTYPGAVINVKNGSTKSTTVSTATPVKPIKPAMSTPTLGSGVEKLLLPHVKTDSLLSKPEETEFTTSILASFGKPTFQVSTSLETPVSPASSLGSPMSTMDNTLDISMGSPPGFGKDKDAMHRSSEQKRRFNIKNGFDTLHVLIPAIMQNSNAKISKAAMLQKTAEYCKKLKQERAQMQSEAEILKNEIEALNNAIGLYHSQLPATGAPVTRQRADQLKKLFDAYVKSRTLDNWKFWIFSKIIAHLFDTFNSMVSTSSVEELCRTTLSWLDQHCSLANLRPAVTNALTSLSTSTSILSDPSKLPEEATKAVLHTKMEHR